MAERSIKIAIILAAADKASAIIGKAFANAEKRAKSFEKVGKSMSDIGSKSLIAGAAVGAPVLGVLKAAADIEKMQVALKTSFRGSQAEADKAFKIINDFAAKTPYGLEEVMTGFIKLKNMGLDPSEKALEAYGNTASAMGKSLNDMVEAVADAATGEFERLKEFGIKASTQKDYVTFMFQGVKTTVKKDAGQIEAYLKKVGSVNFAGGIEAQSKTLYGQWSTVSDSAKMVAGNLGKLLIPAVNNLFAKIGPMLERVQKWVDANPVLAKKILTLTTAVAAGLLAFGGVMKIVGFATSGIGTAIKITSTVMKGFGTALPVVVSAVSKASLAFVKFGAVLLANPITWYVAAAVALGAIVYIVIRNWDKITAFFKRLWAGIKQVFSATWQWLKGMLLNYTPHGLIIKHWSKITGMFTGVWNSVKGIFSAAWKWIAGLGGMFLDAGKNIVTSVWKGIKAMAMKPVEAIKDMVTKIRKYLPFSPAKEGPLKDIHRIKLVETIAQSINAKPLMDAWSRVSSRFLSFITQPASPTAGRAGGGAAAGMQINFSPVINLYGSASAEDGKMLTERMKSEFTKLLRDHQQQQERRAF